MWRAEVSKLTGLLLPHRQRPVWHRLLRRPNGRPAVAPASLGRVTNAGCRASSSPPFHEDWPSLRHRPRGGTGSEENLCSNRLMMEEPQKWREPRRDGFEARSVWSLFNAFTESLKDGNLAELPKRTEALHGLLDTHVGLSA